jgi:hypothetical protein
MLTNPSMKERFKTKKGMAKGYTIMLMEISLLVIKNNKLLWLLLR